MWTAWSWREWNEKLYCQVFHHISSYIIMFKKQITVLGDRRVLISIFQQSNFGHLSSRSRGVCPLCRRKLKIAFAYPCDQRPWTTYVYLQSTPMGSWIIVLLHYMICYRISKSFTLQAFLLEYVVDLTFVLSLLLCDRLCAIHQKSIIPVVSRIAYRESLLFIHLPLGKMTASSKTVFSYAF